MSGKLRVSFDAIPLKESCSDGTVRAESGS
jgi:hypothetical protein